MAASQVNAHMPEEAGGVGEDLGASRVCQAMQHCINVLMSKFTLGSWIQD